jgi:hypothetical protein
MYPVIIILFNIYNMLDGLFSNKVLDEKTIVLEKDKLLGFANTIK